MVMLIPMCLSLVSFANEDTAQDVSDPRGKMVPWTQGAWETGKYRNVFLEAGYSQEEIDAKLQKAYYDLFEGPNRVYFEVGDDMAYVSDIKNRDARTEGLSYGLMVAVQLDKKEVYDKLWRWTVKYMQHQEGPREAYFAWSVNPQTGRQNSQGSASDGEFYFVTALLFASNRWGNDTGIDYYAEARRILDAMWSKDGTGGIRHVINIENKMITFVPEGGGYNWTDPSYHVPAFYEVWAEYAKDGHEDFYRECAEISRQFLHKACHSVTGLTPDQTEFDGSPRGGGRRGGGGGSGAFGFDSWRVPMNIALDYSWACKDIQWQQDYINRLHNFLYARGIDTFEDQFNADGTARQNIMGAGGYRTLRHSIGWVAATAAGSLMSTQAKGWKFVDEVWEERLEPYEDGYFDPYYDGFLYLFSLMHLSGNYKIIKPASETPAHTGKIVLEADNPGAAIDPMFYGIMTEEINYSYEGGLYGELIQNRIFRNPEGSSGSVSATAGTADPGLFRAEHYSMSDFSINVPNGKYTANLYFAETYSGISGPGQRVFTFNVQGKEFRDFDIWVKAGGFNRAYIESVPVEVTNGQFRITFTPQVENPTIKAIELIREGAGEAVRIRAGQSDPFTDSRNQIWQPERGFTGGNTVNHGPIMESTGDSISGAPHWFLLTSNGAQGAAATDGSDPINEVALTNSLKLSISNVPGGGRVGISNDGYWGIPVKPNWTYQCSFYAKASDGFSGPLNVAIESNDGKTVYASATVPSITTAWKQYKLTLKSGLVEETADARFVISTHSKGSVHFNQVSLFQPVFRERIGAALGSRPATGFRADIMQLLDDMHPAYIRFPGGNYIEGSNFANRFNWKEMIGPWENRPGHMSPWGYRSSDGMGLLEFLEWCEELGAEPVVGVYAGLHLDGGRDVRTGETLKPFIQDALDEIEYITGDVTTKWGAQRAKDGHPEPFNLTYVEIGNEDFLNNGTRTYQGPEGRFAMFYNAIKEKYPHIQVIATTNPGRGIPHDVIDNHHYMSPEDAIRNAHLYDNADRNGPKIFEGEWASQERGTQRGLTPSFQCALSDAAFLTGLERNADIVIMTCYAPLFTRVNPGGSQWSTDLIGYDTLTSFGSPSYYVQKMFFNAKGDTVIPVAQIVPQTITTPESAPAASQNRGGRGGRGGQGFAQAGPRHEEPLFACASREDDTGEIILKVVNIFGVDQNITVELKGAQVKKVATGQVMTGLPTDVNSVEFPFNIVPKDFIVTDASSSWNHTFPGHSISVIRFKIK